MAPNTPKTMAAYEEARARGTPLNNHLSPFLPLCPSHPAQQLHPQPSTLHAIAKFLKPINPLRHGKPASEFASTPQLPHQQQGPHHQSSPRSRR